MIYFGMFREEANRTREHPTTSTVLQSFVNCKNTCKDLQKKVHGSARQSKHGAAAAPCVRGSPLQTFTTGSKNHVEIFSAWQDSLGSAKYV